MYLNYRAIIKIEGMMTILLAVSMFPSMFVSAFYGEYGVIVSFTKVIVPLLILGLIAVLKANPRSSMLKVREGILIVGLSWLLATLIGCLPFLVSGSIPAFPDAFFESVSGFTTTGSTILKDVEALPKGILFWRSFTHWLGGMGILFFAISLLPALGMQGHTIARVESTGPVPGKVSAKMSDSAKKLYVIYMSMTVCQTILLMLGGLSLYDALIQTFGSMGTGGLSNYNASIGHFDSLYVELVIMLFMILAGVNFSLYYSVMRGRLRDFFTNGELKLYALFLLGSTALITINLYATGTYETLGDSLRYSSFQASSIMTTTGYMTADFDLWPDFSKVILFMLMFVGGCSSSTSGGMKVVRILVMFKLIRRGVSRKLHPRAVVPIKMDGKAISSDTVSGIASFIFLYIMVFIVGTIILTLDGHDMLTCASSVASALGNIGPGFHLAGPTMNFSFFSGWAKIFLGFIMLTGRLELFTVLALLTPSFWKPDR